MERNKKIGIFDSGFGGLTVLLGIQKKLPEYDYLYLGDTERAPYGPRSQKEIYIFTEQAVKYLFDSGCEIIILACNTASAEALRKIQQEYLPNHHPSKRVLGVLIPACEEAIKVGNKIGIMATESTIDSGAYIRELTKINTSVIVRQIPCPDLVPLIEAGDLSNSALDESLGKYLVALKDVDAIILGCTHYEIIEDKIIQKGGGVKIISQSDLVAERLLDYLQRHPEIENKLSKDKTTKYYTTGHSEKFSTLAREITGYPIESEKIKLS